MSVPLGVCRRRRNVGYAGPGSEFSGGIGIITSPFGRLTTVCLSLLVFLCLLVEAGRAQQVWVRAYENEEDLWESFQEGEITSEQYLELLGLFRAGADSMFQPLSDINGLPGYAISDTVIDMSGGSVKKLHGLLGVRGLFAAGRPELRWGYTLPLQEETKDEGYLVGRWSSKRVQLFVDGRTRSGRFDGFRKRGLAIGFLGGRTRVTLGNFEPRFGLGLVVGRRDRQLGRTVATGLSGSVWQPKYAFYNGLQLEQTLGTTARLVVLGSRIESLPYREDIVAAHLVVAGVGNAFRAGITGVVGVISRRDDKRKNKRGGVGLYLSRAREQNGLRAEFALAGGGSVAVAAQATKPMGAGLLSLSWWTYDPDFFLLSSGGPGHPGRRRVVVFDENLDFYSRTAGEQGLLAKLRTRLGRRTAFETMFEVYNDRLERTKNIEGRLAFRTSLPRKTSLTVYLRGRNKQGAEFDERFLYYGMRGHTYVIGGGKSAWGFEYGTAHKSSREIVNLIKMELSGTLHLNKFVKLTPRLRYVDPNLSESGDGYYYFYLTEGLAPVRSWRLELIMVARGYEDSTKETYADVRVRMSWRP